MSTRSYGQYCGLARALDVLSSRWCLLIVRELLVGPARYGQLHAGLPGVSTNLLAARLRELEQAGVVQRQLDADSNAVAYALTPWGEELRAPIEGLVSWSTPLMTSGPQDDAFQPHWLILALESLLRHKRTETPATAGVEVDGTRLTVTIDATGPHVAREDAPDPPAVLRADALIVLGLASGTLSVEQAIAAGELDGDERVLAAVFDR